FRVIPSNLGETFSRGLKPHQIVTYLAQKKAKDISRKFPRYLVLGADTIVFIDGKIIGKPRNKKHAIQILKKLSGAWQKVYTGVAFVWNGGRKVKAGYAVSRVKIRPLSSHDIKRAAVHHLDKAGAYAIQEKKDPFVEKIIGDYDNVVGLPIRVVKKLVKLAG
ncbi:septum formation protein Maf, partial [bacterium F11]